MARATKLDTVRELQRTLYRAAKADPGRRFHALYDKVYRRDVLERAWELVRANKGAAGVDQQTIADVEEYGVAKLLDELATMRTCALVDAVSVLRSEAEDEVLAGVVCAVVTGVTDASVTVLVADG